MSGLFLLIVFLGATGIGFLICVAEWLEIRRLSRLTRDATTSALRQRMAAMMSREAQLRVVVMVILFVIAAIAMVNPYRAPVTGYAVVSRLMLIVLPVVLMVKAMLTRHERMALADAAHETTEFQDELQAPYLYAIWQTMAVLVVDIESGLIIHASAQAERLFKYPTGTLDGARVERLVPTSLRPVHSAHRAAFAERPHVALMGDRQHPLTGVTSDGDELALAIQLIPVLGNSRVLAVIASFAVTPQEGLQA